MNKVIIYRDKSGDLKVSTDAAPITRDDIVANINRLEARRSEWQTALEEFDRLAGRETGVEAGTHISFKDAPFNRPKV